MRLIPLLSNYFAFYAGWLACVFGAAWGQPLLGTAVAAACILLHVACSADRGREMALVITVGGLGFLVDTAQALGGVLQFGSSGISAWLCPPWLVAIWMLFATTLNGSMQWLAGRYLLAAALGAVCGPLSYIYGARLGALTAVSDNAIGVLAVVWAILMPALLVLNSRFGGGQSNMASRPDQRLAASS